MRISRSLSILIHVCVISTMLATMGYLILPRFSGPGVPAALDLVRLAVHEFKNDHGQFPDDFMDVRPYLQRTLGTSFGEMIPEGEGRFVVLVEQGKYRRIYVEYRVDSSGTLEKFHASLRPPFASGQ